jgi:flagellar motility protein MotE (MotC chaperone)
MHSKAIIPQLITLFLVIGFSSSSILAEEPVEANETAETETLKVKNKTSFDSVEERRLYALLQNERDNLKEEKKGIALKERELKTLQEEADKNFKLLDEKLAELQKVQAKIEALLAEKDVREIKKTKDLSLIYAKMTPDRAALAMAALDEQLAANLLATMKVKSAAKILDRMDKLKASQLSTTFTTIKVE